LNFECPWARTPRSVERKKENNSNEGAEVGERFTAW